MATEKSREDIIDLIRKCLALTKSNQPGEVANAAAKVQELLFKYHLDMVDVETAESGETSPIGEETYSLSPKVHEGKWRLRLVDAIARTNFCKVLWGYKGKYAHIIGTKTDAEAVKEIYVWVRDQLIEMESEYWANSGAVFDRRPTFRRSFFEGAVNEVHHRLYQNWINLQKRTEQSTALVVQTGKAIQEYMDKTYGDNLKAVRSSGSYGSSAGRSAGREAGSRVDIGRPAKRLSG